MTSLLSSFIDNFAKDPISPDPTQSSECCSVSLERIPLSEVSENPEKDFTPVDPFVRNGPQHSIQLDNTGMDAREMSTDTDRCGECEFSLIL